MKNLLSIFGLLLLSSAGIFGNYNLYLNEHETMRLLGKFPQHNYMIKYCAKIKDFFEIVVYLPKIRKMLNFLNLKKFLK